MDYSHLPVSFPKLGDLEPVPLILFVLGVAEVVVPVGVDQVGDVHAPGAVVTVDEDGGDSVSIHVLGQRFVAEGRCPKRLSPGREYQDLGPAEPHVPPNMSVDLQVKTDSELWTPVPDSADLMVLLDPP